MRILIVSDGYPENDSSLSGIFAFDQAKALRDLGHQVIVASINLRSLRRRRKFGMFWDKKQGIDIINYSVPLGRVPSFLHLALGKIAIVKMYYEVIRRYNTPDIVHAHFTLYGNIASVLKDKFSLPFVLTEHNSSINEPIISKNLLKLGKSTYSKADSLICVSSVLAEKIDKNWGIKALVIHNIVDTTIFNFPNTKTENCEFIFLSIGNLLHGKGFDVLIEAFAKANFKKNVHLQIIGIGETYKKLQQLISVFGQKEQVSLLGFRNRKEIAKLMQSSDAFVLASRAETFGVVYIEAMSAGLPVIATTCGGPEDFVDESNGILVPINDVDALADALIKMFKTANNYDRNNIVSLTQQKFSPNAIASQLTDIYIDVINKTKK